MLFAAEEKLSGCRRLAGGKAAAALIRWTETFRFKTLMVTRLQMLPVSPLCFSLARANAVSRRSFDGGTLIISGLTCSRRAICYRLQGSRMYF